MSSAAFPETAMRRAIVSAVPEGSRFDMTGRVALVTGQAGHRSAIAEALAEQGAQVVLSSRKQADLDQESERINAIYPERAWPIAATPAAQKTSSASSSRDGAIRAHRHPGQQRSHQPYFGPGSAPRSARGTRPSR